MKQNDGWEKKFLNKDMRVAVTGRMLREGMLRCLETKSLSRITASGL